MNVQLGRSPWTIVAVIAGILGAVVILALVGDQLSAAAKTIIISQMLMWVPTVLTLRRVESVQHDIRNGVMKEGVKDAITEMAEDPENGTVAMIVAPGYSGPERRH